MIRLPSSHAAVTMPLVASSTRFPGIPIGRSVLDGRPFHLSPVQVDEAVLPSTNSLALGGLGSGKSTTAKTRGNREVWVNDHQYVVIDCYRADSDESEEGEWSPLTRSVGGRVIEASTFTLNPLSRMFAFPVREQLVRSLIAAVEPSALTPQATHALQHALNHPKSIALPGLVDALTTPQDGRWPATKLSDWGEGAAMALSRYTEGSLAGLFDGQDAMLPETDLPILTFDFSRMDRSSPAIPALMAAIGCWIEHVWLRQSTAVHRHLVLEEAWQLLLSPATSELIQRLLKDSRKAALSLDVVMHTLSDMGEGRAQDLAKLCEIAHVGRLGPEEAARVGSLLGLPDWAIARIPKLGPGQALWKVGPDYVDIIQTVCSEEELKLTDTSSRRRRAQQTAAAEEEGEEHLAATVPPPDDGDDQEHDENLLTPCKQHSVVRPGEDQGWQMPPAVDFRHQAVLKAAMEGRHSEAADLAALGEREDIAAHGLNSPAAVAWLTTRAQVADLRGDRHQAAQLRATVTRMSMGNETEWWQKKPEASPAATSDAQAPMWQPEPPPPTPAPVTATDDAANSPRRRRTWPSIAAIVALSLAGLGVWQHADHQQQAEERQQTAHNYKGRSGADLRLDGVDAEVVAHWTSDRDRVIVELRTYFDEHARYLRIDASGKSASSVRKDGWFPKSPEIALSVKDPLADVTVHVEVGGKEWKRDSPGESRTVRLSPTGIAYDAQSGQQLPSNL